MLVPVTPRSALPPMAVLALALLASWAIHVPIYVGLGVLKRVQDLLAHDDEPIDSTMEVELVLDTPDAPEPEQPEQPEVEPLEEERDEPPPAAEDEAPERVAAAPEPEPEPEPAVAMPTPPTPQPPPPSREMTSVEHRSRDPDVEPPPDAQHLAEENSRVEEETQARIRNPNLNDEEPTPAAPEEASEAPEEGDSDEQRQAELQDVEGSDERDPTPEETRDPPRPPTPDPSRSPTPAMAEAARGGDTARGGNAEASRAREAPGGGARTEGGGEAPMREMMVTDGNGSFTVLVPSRPEGAGEGDEGGERVEGPGEGDRGEGRASGRAGRGRRAARGGRSRGRGAPNLRLSWSDFASLYGEEELEREREARLEQQRSRNRGVSRAERWRRFRAAIENYDVRVRPGNQTALNTRADPFARYIAAMHRRIHPRFALGYLRRVPSTVDESFRANPNMHTNLEIGIDAEGRVDHVSVVGTSGDILFDLGAYEAVMGAQPFPETPSNIRSPDGLTYMRWAFYRNQRQCGTFNAQAFILAEAPERDDDEDDTLTRPDAVLPTEEEGGGARGADRR